ncbi:F-box protein [Acorus calamus]|uniref:F-box protein n=1 Tax=Acorus calamus TaxID=4465 RepID=A0AAV9E5H6_ACOCL|nr:F-box protein [Acorus calamus]
MGSSRPQKRARVADEEPQKISEDVLYEIISQLPLKSLGRFACVSNTWRHNVSDISLNKPPELMSSGLFYEYGTFDKSVTGYALLPTSIHSEDAILMNTNSISDMTILSCSHGLILCSNYSSLNEYRIINPLTTQMTSLPQSSHPSFLFGATLIIDPDYLSYKVVQLITKANHALVGVDIISSETGRWEEYEGEKTARVIELPCQGLWNENPNCLGVSQGRLQFAAHDFVGVDGFLQPLIWVLEEGDQWVLKHRLGPLDYHLLAFHPDLNAVFFYCYWIEEEEHKILLYDLTDMKMKDVCTFYNGDEFDMMFVNCYPISPSLVNPRKLGVT